MSKTLSLDLRVRVIEVVAEDLSHRAAATRFGVSAASDCRRARVEGDPRPGALGGVRHSGRIEAHRELILDVLTETRDSTIEELRRLLAGRGLDFGYGSIQRFLIRHQMTRKKKTGNASDRTARMFSSAGKRGARARSRSIRRVKSSSTRHQHGRAHSRALKDRRLRMGQPHSHWKTSTFVAGLTLGGMIAPFVLDGPITRLAFETYVEKVLVPELRPGEPAWRRNLQCTNIQSGPAAGARSNPVPGHRVKGRP